MFVWRKIGFVLILFCLGACIPVNQKKVGVSDTSQTVDTTPPTNTSISIDAGAVSTNSTSVSLILSATEATEMYVTNTSGCGSGGSWEAYATSKAWTLAQTNGTATVYVIYRDSLLNESACINDTIIQVDESPTMGTGITFSNLTNSSVTVAWGAANDSLTANSDLEYKIVRATSSELIDTVAEVEAIAGPELVLDWSVNTTQTSATGLSDATTYFFSGLVKDGAGNKTLYTPESIKTLDGTAPSVGTGLVFSLVASDSMTVSWGAANDNSTPQESLRYKLVKSLASEDIDTISEVESISGADLLVDWDINTLTHAVTGLTVDTNYYFAVLVRDAYDNVAIYPIANQTTFDGVAPTIGPAITFSSVTSESMTVSWGAGSDNVTPQESLQYRLVKANTAAEIDSIDEVEAISGADLLVDWGTNTLSNNATGLSEATTYYFSVVVRDSSNNKAIYTVQGQSTSDSTAPEIGSGITYTNIASTSVTVNWGKATDTVTVQAFLEYKVVKALSSGAIDSIPEADGVSSSDIVIDWTTDIDTVSATGLSAATFYYFAVLVRDSSGNKSLYFPKVRFTGKMIWVAQIPTEPYSFLNNFAVFTGNLGGISGADQKCSENRPSYSKVDQTSVVKALLVDGVSRIACQNYSLCNNPSENLDWVLSPNTTYYAKNGGSHRTTNNAGVWEFDSTSGVTAIDGSHSPRIWTGFRDAANGDWRAGESFYKNCGAWTGGASATVGEAYNSSHQMLYGAILGCGSYGGLYCVEQ